MPIQYIDTNYSGKDSDGIDLTVKGKRYVNTIDDYKNYNPKNAVWSGRNGSLDAYNKHNRIVTARNNYSNSDEDDGDNDSDDNYSNYDTLLSEIKNLAQQKYDAQINLINTYLEQQRKANQQEYEANRDQAEVNYFNGLRRMREQNGNTNGYNDSGLNRTNQLYFNSSRANTNSNLRKALDANNINAEYNAQAMRTNATNNYYDDYQTYLNMLNKYIKK